MIVHTRTTRVIDWILVGLMLILAADFWILGTYRPETITPGRVQTGLGVVFFFCAMIWYRVHIKGRP